VTSNWFDTFWNTLPSSIYVLSLGLKTKCHTHTREQADRAGPRQIVDFQKLAGKQAINSCLSWNSNVRYQIHKTRHMSVFRTRWIQSPPSHPIYQSILKLFKFYLRPDFPNFLFPPALKLKFCLHFSSNHAYNVNSSFHLLCLHNSYTNSNKTILTTVTIKCFML
jgi:hypothetical protein